MLTLLRFNSLLLAILALSSTAQAAASIQVVSFNLYNRPYERETRLKNAVQTVKALQPDVLALQEVSQGWILPNDPLELFSSALSFHSARAWHETNWGIFKTGLATLSRFPIIHEEYHDFKDHDCWDYKGYLVTVLKTSDHDELGVINLHMASTSSESTRTSEWRELMETINQQPTTRPLLVIGDFNTDPQHPVMQEFTAATGMKSIYDQNPELRKKATWTPNYQDDCSVPTPAGPTWDDHATVLDFAFVRGAEIKNGSIVAPTLVPHPSDHCPISMEMGWK